MAGAELLPMRPTPRLARLPDWPERLAAFFAERAARPFAWGEHDCMTFAADAVMMLTGRDPIARWRGAYASEGDGNAIVGSDGLLAFVARAMEDFGAPECPVPHAQRGDWAMIEVGNMLSAGVVTGAFVAAPGLRRLAHVPLRRAVAAWVI